MPIEAESVHLVGGLFVRPVLEGHAVRGDENAGAIFAVVTMNEDDCGRVVTKNREKFDDLRVRWGGKTTHRDVHETQTERLSLPAFGGDIAVVFEAKIYDGGDTHFLEFGERGEVGLRAAVEMIVNFSGIGNPVDVNFFGAGRLHDGPSRRSLWKGWRKKKWQEK